MEDTITLTLNKEEREALKMILFYWIDQIEYDVEQCIKKEDPDGELEELSDHLLITLGINNKLEPAWTKGGDFIIPPLLA